ncbi:DUF2164 family protein [Terrilactibacillus sp. BCM23-1]|uniref:DUF2164 family protein n=1 Tax=Terrilactibacillus tamarindi TaxID=2599694 RepID=A0A6N8CUS2_9BACI|nr:DUF2164 family protein [Terrilactibacillus tamarindi]MTT33117.1 DUF2164 family protein [Terrilactibacillus tamarindi]
MRLRSEQKNAIIEKLQDYYYTEHEKELGIIGAENLYDFFMKNCAPLIYDLAIEDAQGVILQQFESVREDIEVLKKR